MKTLTSIVALHGIHYAIEARTGLELWESLRSTTIEVHMAEVEAREPVAARPGDREYDVNDGVAIVSICGPMTKARTSMGSGASTVEARRQVRAAANDPDVRAIMVRIDSPGGSVSGTSDLAEDVRAAAKKKPTMAYIEDLGCSAAYWVASQCGTVVANPTAMVGSIGTYCVVSDYSGYFEALGIKTHLVATGEHKGAGAPGTAISDAQLAEFQREVADLNSHFLSAVSRGRKMPMSELKTVADGRVFVGKHALQLGLVDGIGSFDQALADLRNSVGKIGPKAEEAAPFVVALSEAMTAPLSLTEPAEAVAEASAQEEPARDPSEATTPDTSAEAQQPEPTTPDDEALALLDLALSL